MLHFTMIIAALLAYLPTSPASRGKEQKGSRGLDLGPGNINLCPGNHKMMAGSMKGGSFVDLSDARDPGSGDGDLEEEYSEDLGNLQALLSRMHSSDYSDCGWTEFTSTSKETEVVTALEKVGAKIHEIEEIIAMNSQEVVDLTGVIKEWEKERPITISKGDYDAMIEEVMQDDTDKDCWHDVKPNPLTDPFPFEVATDTLIKKVDSKIEELNKEDKAVEVYGADFRAAFERWLGQDEAEVKDACNYIKSRLVEEINKKQMSTWWKRYEEMQRELSRKVEISVELEGSPGSTDPPVDPIEGRIKRCKRLETHFTQLKDQLHALKEDKKQKERAKLMAKKVELKAKKSVKEITDSVAEHGKTLDSVIQKLTKEGEETEKLRKDLEKEKQKEEEMLKKTVDTKNALDRTLDSIKKSATASEVADNFKELLTEFLEQANKVHERILLTPLQEQLGLDNTIEGGLSKFFEQPKAFDAYATAKSGLEATQLVCETGRDELGSMAEEGLQECGKKPADMCGLRLFGGAGTEAGEEMTMEAFTQDLHSTQSLVAKELKDLLDLVPRTPPGDPLVEGRQKWQEPEGSIEFELLYGDSTFFKKYLLGWTVQQRDDKIDARIFLKLWWYLSEVQKDLGTAKAHLEAMHGQFSQELEELQEANRDTQKTLQNMLSKLDLTRQQREEYAQQLQKLTEESEELARKLKEAQDTFIQASAVAKKSQEVMSNAVKAMRGVNALQELRGFAKSSLLQLGLSRDQILSSVSELSDEDVAMLRLAGSTNAAAGCGAAASGGPGLRPA